MAKIIVYYDPPPIPMRAFDWRAVTDQYDGPGSPVGFGRTEDEARRDLEEQLEEKPMSEILVNGQSIAYDEIPVRYMADGMRNYFEHGILPGSFGTALLCGDFMEICARADDNNRACLWQWATWLYNHAPAGSYGSRRAVESWVKERRQEPVT